MLKTYTFWQRILGFGCALAILLLLAACGKAKPADVPTTEAPASTAADVSPATEPSTVPIETPESSAPAETPEAPAFTAPLPGEPGATAAPDSVPPVPALEPGAVEFEYEGDLHYSGSFTDSKTAGGSRGDDAVMNPGTITDFIIYEPEAPEEPAAVDPADPVPVPVDPTPISDDPPVEPSEPLLPPDIPDPWIEPDPGEAFVLTAAEWNDNANWPFFTNLVSGGRISFPAYGIDPRNRVKVTVRDESGAPLEAEAVSLLDEAGNVLWNAKTNRDGVAYLFFREEETPSRISAAGAEDSLVVYESEPGGQGTATTRRVEELSVTRTAAAAPRTGLQVMFIVDTTGSMGDELSYLQKDFSSIAADVGSDGVSYSACFYRDDGDEYVTRCNPFTNDVGEVQRLIAAEYADGGGDTPEAVAQILTETLAASAGWNDQSVKLAFLIFDAPPHAGTEDALVAAVRSAAEQGIHLVPVVASNADRETELFGRALAICTDGTYVFLTDDSGVGGSHLEPIIGDYDVELLHDVIVRIIEGYRPAA